MKPSASTVTVVSATGECSLTPAARSGSRASSEINAKPPAASERFTPSRLASERSGCSSTPTSARAAAATVAIGELTETSARVRSLADRLIEGVLSSIDDTQLNGATGQDRLPGNTHFTFRGCEGDSLLMLLDAKGVECSTGSACTAGVARPSHVLLAMGADPVNARGSLRLSLGHTSTQADVDAALQVLPAVVQRARQAALASAGTVS